MGYGFVEFAGEEDCEYAIKVMNMISLFGRPIRVNPVRKNYLCVILDSTNFSYSICKGFKNDIGCRSEPFYWKLRRRGRREVIVRYV